MDIMYIIPLGVHSHWHWWVMQKVSNDQRGRLLMTTERLNQSTDRIKESRRTMLETEELGVSILQNLHQQRQSLLHANNTVCRLLFLFVPIHGSLPLGNRFIMVFTFYILYVSFLYFMCTTLHPFPKWQLNKGIGCSLYRKKGVCFSLMQSAISFPDKRLWLI